MDSANTSDFITSATYIDPDKLANFLSDKKPYCLFLDIDGTLAEFTVDPKDSFIPTSTLDLIQAIQDYGVKVAVVTGRSLNEAKQMLSLLEVPIAATHGLQLSWLNGNIVNINLAQLTQIKDTVTHYCLPYPDLYIENKPYSCTLHYRKNPTLADISYDLMSKAIANFDNWSVKQGKYVWEAIPKSVNKGLAILDLLQHISLSEPLCPIFIGDDITDEAGFAAVQNVSIGLDSDYKSKKLLTGMGIKVGNEATCANYYVQDIDEVRDLLHSFLKIAMSDSL
ncbi:trehalose-phosphatase [Psychrobacter piechaudii]|uniref:Trehalose 6-phosphate phosphatase n=1 Tax=Psychrobacter piechaudii TaxID=1945521 RepID=A0A1R4GQC1_9GAMM|nr:trehalose-phosphatase [Psychrobacter piechaudii]SJM70440.1 Trehalose-6-phosphate phosphatase [Psychrobacter piechaudii]